VGYQESFVKFENNEVAIEEIKAYMARDRESYTTRLYTVKEVVKDIPMFKKGELVMVVGGERADQRGPFSLEEGIGIKNAVDVIYIDDYLFDHRGNKEGKDYLAEHFRNIHPSEIGMEV